MGNTNHIFVIDFEQMKREVRKKAEQLLEEINEDNIEYFVKEVKKLAKHILGQYVYSIYKYYTEGAAEIKDVNSLEAFTNTDTGFYAKMSKWKDRSEILIEKEEVEYPKMPLEPNLKTYYKTTIVVGTIFAAGLLIFKQPWWIVLVVELLTLSVSYAQYRHISDTEKKYNKQLEEYQIKTAELKKTYVDDIISDIETWLVQGQEKSIELLKTYVLI
jgi:hypothetical protein